MFISHGDYIFPLQAIYYWLKHLYVWSFQTGATNLDGIIRLPGRALYALFFQLFGHMGIAYFFLLSSFLIAFFAFYYFGKHFFGSTRRSTLIIAALFFACNPIFLGNTAKTGLIVAVAMLPLCLVFVQRAFRPDGLRYLIFYLFALNISLIHPFTFAVNSIVSGAYLLYLLWCHKKDWRRFLSRLVVVGALALLMNLYFILPVLSLGTVSKTALSQEISEVTIDYTQLVDIANTGDIFTALSLSKTVLKDFEFYTAGYAFIYFAAVFSVYILLLVLYIRAEGGMKRRDRLAFVWLMVALVLLMIMSTASYFGTDSLIKFVIDLPGGWMFRSPLKWQLYIPLILGALLVLLLRLARSQREHWLGVAALAVIVALANPVLLYEIGTKLLKPRAFEHFAALNALDMNDKHLLMVNSDTCAAFARQEPRVMTELNQVFLSKNVQLKKIDSSYIDTVRLEDYAYVLGCDLTEAEEKTVPASFERRQTFADETFVLFENTQVSPTIYAFDTLYSLDSIRGADQKATFAESALGQKFHFVNEQDYNQHVHGLNSAFETLERRHVASGAITSTILPNKPGEQELFIRNNSQLFYKVDGTKVLFSPTPFTGSEQLDQTGQFARLNVRTTENETITFSYQDQRFAFQNLIANASLEAGPWQQQVGDCNAYDDKPAIGMVVDNTNASDGEKSLRLTAERHIACSGPTDIAIKPGATYLLSMDYQSSGKRQAGFHISFDDSEGMFKKEILSDRGKGWQTLSRVITAPADASQLSVMLYALPDEIAGRPADVRYDNLQLIEIPAIADQFYVLNAADTVTREPQSVSFDSVNPTKNLIDIKNVTAPFYLAMKDSYHAGWRLSLHNATSGVVGNLPWLQTPGVTDEHHFRLNNGMNGWYVDPAALCKQKLKYGCARNSDGSYELHLIAEFTPQRWFTLGLVVSALTMGGMLGYVIIGWYRQKGLGS